MKDERTAGQYRDRELFQMGYKDVFSVRDSIKEQIYKNE